MNINETVNKLRSDLSIIVDNVKPIKGLGILKDHLTPFDKSDISGNDVVAYIHRDMDGFLSGIIIDQFFDGVELRDIQYNEKASFEGLEDKVVFVADFTFKPEEMKELNEKCKRLIWIDHHISALNDIKEAQDSGEVPFIEGLQCVGPAGCELTWMYLHGSCDHIPAIVLFAGAYDVFRYNSDDPDNIFERDMKFQDEIILPMCYAYKNTYTDHKDTALRFATQMDDGEVRSILNQLFAEGTAIWNYVKKQANESVRNHGFLLEVEGVKFVAMFNNCRGSAEFGDAVQSTEAQAMLAIMPMDKGSHLSFYCDGDIDMSKVANKFGGGGHRGASGAFVNYKQLFDLVKKAKPLEFKDKSV